MPNIIYILTNPALDGLIKIGKTTNLVDRLRSLSSSTSIPAPFAVYYHCEIRDDFKLEEVERNLHFVFGPERYNKQREFFRTDPERARTALLPYAKLNKIDQDPGLEEYEREVAEETALTEASNRPRTRFRFSEIGIEPGTELKFFRDDNIFAVVYDDTRIQFNGEITTVSAAANLITQQKNGKPWGGSGTIAWLYNGETLYNRRLRLENIGD